MNTIFISKLQELHSIFAHNKENVNIILSILTLIFTKHEYLFMY